MPAYTHDESKFPLVHVTFHDLMNEVEFEESLAKFEQLLSGARQFAIVVESHHSKLTPFSQIRRQAEMVKRTREQAKRLMRGVAMVFPSPVMRGVLKVLLSLAPFPIPYALFDNVPEAEAWARGCLGKDATRAPS
jgi:hypothetical protein